MCPDHTRTLRTANNSTQQRIVKNTAPRSEMTSRIETPRDARLLRMKRSVATSKLVAFDLRQKHRKQTDRRQERTKLIHEVDAFQVCDFA